MNKFLQGKHPNPMGDLHHVKAPCLGAQSSFKDQDMNRFNPNAIVGKRWIPPLHPMVKLNIDATFNQCSRKGFIGVCCRDKDGTLITTSCQIFVPYPLIAGALDLREALIFARNLNALSANL